MADDMKHVKMEVMRYNPETDDAPHFVTYDVPYDEQTSLLDALGYIKDNLAPEICLTVGLAVWRFVWLLWHDG